MNKLSESVPKEFYFASHNKNKWKELSELFDPEIIKPILPHKGLDVEETGSTYLENAFIKAKAFYDLLKMPTIADDSGLEVEALPNELGIFSNRFGGGHLDDKSKCELLLKRLEGEKNRRAYFVCVLCFYCSPAQVFFFEGRLRGEIGTKIIGEGGFGYDPLFVPEFQNFQEDEHKKLSLAQLNEWKKEHSHRALACREAQKFFLQQRVCQNK